MTAERLGPAAKADDSPEGPDRMIVPSAASVRPSVLWWAVLVAYLVLFLATGYLSFFTREQNPALDENLNELAARVTDQEARAFLIDTLKDEAIEHRRREALALQSFNIVLGALLGFLSASAVGRLGKKEDS
ncbi:MAG TPA: hypothetical protein VIG62_18500 [Blastocatellia bacterium]|jgi:hypothetical protein